MVSFKKKSCCHEHGNEFGKNANRQYKKVNHMEGFGKLVQWPLA